jgi:hypothetical protein
MTEKTVYGQTLFRNKTSLVNVRVKMLVSL